MASVPTNLKPFRRIINRVTKRLQKKCVDGKTGSTRIYHVSAWVPFLLFDLRYAPANKSGFHNVDPNTVLKYQCKRKITHAFGRELCEQPPLDWIEQSLDVLIDNEVIHYNGKSDHTMRIRPSRWLLTQWEACDVLEGQFNPFSDDAQMTINRVLKDVKRLRMIVAELCKLTGCEYTP